MSKLDRFGLLAVLCMDRSNEAVQPFEILQVYDGASGARITHYSAAGNAAIADAVDADLTKPMVLEGLIDGLGTPDLPWVVTERGRLEYEHLKREKEAPPVVEKDDGPHDGAAPIQGDNGEGNPNVGGAGEKEAPKPLV